MLRMILTPEYRVKHIIKKNGEELFFVQEKILFFWTNHLDFDNLLSAMNYMKECIIAEEKLQSQEPPRTIVKYYYHNS